MFKKLLFFFYFNSKSRSMALAVKIHDRTGGLKLMKYKIGLDMTFFYNKNTIFNFLSV